MKFVLLTAIAIALIVLVTLAMLGYQSRRSAPALGVTDGRFAPCPSSPNCVSSDERDELHGYRLWTVTGADSWELIVAVIAAEPNSRIVEQSENYVRAEFASTVFGFIDDLELNLRGREVATRSASRVGRSDFGANRKRLDRLGALLKSVDLIY